MSDVAATGVLFLMVIGAWVAVSAGSSLRPIEGHPFGERAVAMGLVLAPIFAGLALIVTGFPLLAYMPTAFRAVSAIIAIIGLIVASIGGMWLLWAISQKSPKLRRLWDVAEQVRLRNWGRA